MSGLYVFIYKYTYTVLISYLAIRSLKPESHGCWHWAIARPPLARHHLLPITATKARLFGVKYQINKEIEKIETFVEIGIK